MGLILVIKGIFMGAKIAVIILLVLTFGLPPVPAMSGITDECSTRNWYAYAITQTVYDGYDYDKNEPRAGKKIVTVSNPENGKCAKGVVLFEGKCYQGHKGYDDALYEYHQRCEHKPPTVLEQQYGDLLGKAWPDENSIVVNDDKFADYRLIKQRVVASPQNANNLNKTFEKMVKPFIDASDIVIKKRKLTAKDPLVIKRNAVEHIRRTLNNTKPSAKDIKKAIEFTAIATNPETALSGIYDRHQHVFTHYLGTIGFNVNIVLTAYLEQLKASYLLKKNAQKSFKKPDYQKMILNGQTYVDNEFAELDLYLESKNIRTILHNSKSRKMKYFHAGKNHNKTDEFEYKEAVVNGITYVGIATSILDKLELLEKIPGGRAVGTATDIIDVILIPNDIKEWRETAKNGIDVSAIGLTKYFLSCLSPVGLIKNGWLKPTVQITTVYWEEKNRQIDDMISCFDDPNCNY